MNDGGTALSGKWRKSGVAEEGGFDHWNSSFDPDALGPVD
jgi:hypothetical protein